MLLPRGVLSYPFVLRNRATVVPVDQNQPRDQFFIGNTIANLRGLDPTYGEFTLTLIDGRRPAPGTSQDVALPEVDARGVRNMPARSAPRTPPKVQVWAAEGRRQPDFTQLAVTGSFSRTGCGPSCMADEILYRFSIPDGEQAVAAAISIDDEYYIENCGRWDRSRRRNSQGYRMNSRLAWLAAAIVLTGVAGCQSAGNPDRAGVEKAYSKCNSLGYKPGSDAHAACMMDQGNETAYAREAAIRDQQVCKAASMKGIESAAERIGAAVLGGPMTSRSDCSR